MRTVNDFPSKAGATAEIVVGGHKKHPDPDQGNKFQTTNPLTHGPNINPRDYPYTMIVGQCTQAALETQDPPPEPGSCVIKLPVMGSPSSAVGIGVLKDKNMGSASAGNMNNMSFPGIAQALTADVEKKLSKGYETKQEDGAEVRREKDGSNWNHNMTKGLPTHAALYPLAGTVLQARQQIETAVQQFGNILSSSAQGQMPGSFMSIDSLFNKMTKKQKKRATKKMPKDVLQAFESMLSLMQNGDAGTSFVGGRVHEETFIENALKLLENAKDVNDIIAILHRLQYDEELFGLDKLADTEIEVETPFGKIKQKIDSKGNVKDDIPEVVQKAIEAFGQMLTTATSAPGGGSGENMFGEHAKTMADMLGRVAPDVQKFRKEMLEQLNTSADAEKMKEILNLAAWKGGNPLSMIG